MPFQLDKNLLNLPITHEVKIFLDFFFLHTHLMTANRIKQIFCGFFFLFFSKKQEQMKKEVYNSRRFDGSHIVYEKNFTSFLCLFIHTPQEGKYVVGRQIFVDRHLVDRLLSKNFRRHDTSSIQHFVDKHFVEIFSSTRHFVDTTLRRQTFRRHNTSSNFFCRHKHAEVE